MNGLRKFLHGIYGIDGLSCSLLLLSVLLNLATAFFPSGAARNWNLICYLPLAIIILRAFSHNHARRNRENQVFLKMIAPLLERAEGHSGKKEETKLFKFFKCPACRQKIRVPKGKGRVEITCPKCGEKFIKKT